MQWWDPNGNSTLGSALFILNITRAQAGEYHCVLTFITNETTSATTTIIVQCEQYLTGGSLQYHQIISYVTDPPTATPEGPTLVKVLPRTNVTLSCGFTGLPVPNITWTRNGDPNIRGVATTVTTGNRSQLTVQEVTHEQDRDGVYRCTASNMIGRVSLVDFTVQAAVSHTPLPQHMHVTMDTIQSSQSQQQDCSALPQTPLSPSDGPTSPVGHPPGLEWRWRYGGMGLE